MAKDDYFIIVYKVLKYLYRELKKGHEVPFEILSSKLDLPRIEKSYWKYIIDTLYDDKYITGKVEEVQYIHEDEPTRTYESIQITPKGIEYLIDNSMMKKAKNIVKETVNIIK